MRMVLANCKRKEVITHLSWDGRSNGTADGRYRDQSKVGLKWLDSTPSTSRTYVASGFSARAGNREG